MAALHHGITITCDQCGRRVNSGRRTVVGARGDARRSGWLIATNYGGAASGRPGSKDVCPLHRELPARQPDQLV